MKRTIKFYTSEDEKRMIEVYGQHKNQTEASRVLSKELKRSVASVQVKLSKLLREGSSAKRVKNESKGVTLPTGFTFDIKPSRVTMFEDHVRLYF